MRPITCYISETLPDRKEVTITQYMGFPLVPHLDLYDAVFSHRCEDGLRPK